MSKRFTETDKWKNRWFVELKPEFKLAWIYLIDNCDNSGVIDIIPNIANSLVGFDVDWARFKEKANERTEEPRIMELRDGKWWVIPLVAFQQPNGLSEKNPSHKQILKLLQRHGVYGFAVDLGLINQRPYEGATKPLPRGSSNSKGNGNGTSKKKKNSLGPFEQIEAPESLAGILADISRWFTHCASINEKFTVFVAENQLMEFSRRGPDETSAAIDRSLKAASKGTVIWDEWKSKDTDNGEMLQI